MQRGAQVERIGAQGGGVAPHGKQAGEGELRARRSRRPQGDAGGIAARQCGIGPQRHQAEATEGERVGPEGHATARSGRQTRQRRIELRGLRLVGVVGVLPEERTRAQPLELDVDLAVDISSAGASDALEDTVDYGAVCDTLSEVVAGLRPELLERLAVVAAEAVLALDPRIESVELAVRKLRPPVPHALASSGVRVTRSRRS